MSSNYVIAIPPTGRVKRITVPSGLKNPITAILWGAGGGGGGDDGQYSGGTGALGQAYKVTFNAEAGDVIDIGVGSPGQPGGSSSKSAAGGAGGDAYIDSSNNKYRGGNGGTAGGTGTSGGGGGGGGATTLALNGTVIAVAAGGGGGGGAGNTGLYTTGPSDYATASQWHAVTGASTWTSFMKSYAIWKGGDTDAGTNTFSTTINIPSAGTYTSEISADNNAVVSFGGSPLNVGNFNTTPALTSGVLTAGVKTLTVSVTNVGSGTGNPAGIAIRIKDPNGTIIWDTRQWIAGQYSYVVPQAGGVLGGDNAVNTSSAGSVTNGTAGTNKSGDGGGGGGGGGGKNGGTGGTTRTGDQGAYPGTTGASWRHPSLTLTGTAYVSTNRIPPVVDSYSVDTTYATGGNAKTAGKAGYGVVIVESAAFPYIKENDEWYQVTNVYTKVGTDWKNVSNVYTKQNGQWKLLTQSSKIVVSELSAGVNFGS